MPCSLNVAASRWPGGSSTSAGRCEGPPRRSKCHRRPPPGGPPIIPFGKLAKLAGLADFAQIGARFPRLSGALRLGGSEFLDFHGSINAFLTRRIPDLFEGAHGLNSQNLMRVINMPAAFLIQGNEWVDGWRVGWPALAGNPQNIPEDLGGSVDTMLKFMGILKDGSEKLATV